MSRGRKPKIRMRICHYCGDPGRDRDHIVPTAYRTTKHWDADIVRACADCNQKILMDKPLFSFESRLEHVLGVLQKRLIRALDRDENAPETLSLALRVGFARDVMRRLRD